MTKRSTHFENNLRIPKDSCKIVNTLPSNIFKLSAISRNFNLSSPKTILWTFVMFSRTTAGFGLPERSASSVFVQSRLNSTYQSLIVDFPFALSKNPNPTPDPNRILRWNLRRNLRRKRIWNLRRKRSRNRYWNLGPDPPSDPTLSICILTGKFVIFLKN